MEGIKEKADYCLNCKVKPCSNKGCPLHNEIPDFNSSATVSIYEIISKFSGVL